MANRKRPFGQLFTESGVTTSSVGETTALGREFAAHLGPGSVVSLNGPLGAGKTHFVQGVAEGLGCVAAASSPTFAILHEYAGGRLTVFHFDFYRLENAAEALTAGFDDCLDSGVTVIEWGGKFPDLLPDGTLHLEIAILPGDTRRIRSHQ